ncbi:MAG TPA: Gfo/Idh/MocA family oxidoreductase [Pseudolabrys sp.]|nr:Gfo/Idh/MocA family oxidoreductase [Pseudolabrys sp.]
MLRGAFIGFGNVAAKGHLPGWQSVKDVQIVAATDAVEAQGSAFLEACPGGRWHESVDSLLADKTLDFVDICTPPSSHAALIKRALDAGLHVLCEKPLVTRIGDAQAVAAAAAKSGRAVHTVHNWLKAPICDRISSLVDEGAVGSVQTVHWQTLRTQPAITVTSDGSNWRADPAVAGGGILFDHGWHALYCVMRWSGIPRGVSALLEKRRFREWPIEDTATVTLDLMSGSAQIFLTWAANERANRIEIEGDRGRIEVADDVVVLKSGQGERKWPCPPPLSQGSHHRDWFIGVAQDFRRAATAGGKGNLDEAVLCARLIDLAQRSSAAGGVRLPLEALTHREEYQQ